MVVWLITQQFSDTHQRSERDQVLLFRVDLKLARIELPIRWEMLVVRQAITSTTGSKMLA